MLVVIVFAALSSLSNAGGAVLQRLAAVETPPGLRSPWKSAVYLVRQPLWLLGGLCLVGTFAFSALALYFGPMSVVQPVLMLELIFTLALRAWLLHDDIVARTWLAALTICAGLGTFLIIADPREGTHVPSAGQWIAAISTRGGVVVALLMLSRYGSPARRAAFLGAATAVVWSVDAAFVKATVNRLAQSGLTGLVFHWPLYAMVFTGVAGTILLQGAFRVGPLASSQASMLIIDPLASILLGIQLFQEQLRTGPSYVFGAVLSLAVLGAGVVMLSAWDPPVLTTENRI
jgi:hypothetical protein